MKYKVGDKVRLTKARIARVINRNPDKAIPLFGIIKDINCFNNIIIEFTYKDGETGEKFEGLSTWYPDSIEFYNGRSSSSGANCTKCGAFNEYQEGPFVCYSHSITL